RANSTMHSGKWEKKSLQGSELRGKKLGIVGLGRIGLEVARRARQFGMELVGHDPFVSASIARENAIRLVSVEELFTMADFLTLHVGLTPQTTGIINAATLATMKRGVRIINCARGELVVEADLAAALQSGQVAGAALDVFHQEPPKDSPFTSLDNVILTPHIAGSTAEAQEAVGVQIALQVREYLKSGIAQNAVNLPSLSHEEYQELAPWMILAERLGTFLAQIPRGSIDSIQLSYHGRLAETKTELVRNAAIAGVLGHLEQVNRINAASVAQERGIRLHEEKTEEPRGATGSVFELRLHTSETSMAASGAVLHGESPRLLHLDGIDIEAPLQGTLLTIRNKDVPGVIGRIGTILGEHKVNIANFALGRANVTGPEPASALAVVQVDGAVTDDVMRELRAVPAVTGVRLVTLAS
ncbi:MAG: NAD(P)-dependent oxidoreductase, partial [Acidobacteriota bacterium]